MLLLYNLIWIILLSMVYFNFVYNQKKMYSSFDKI